MAGFAVMAARLQALALVLCTISPVVGSQAERELDGPARNEDTSLALQRRAVPSFVARILPLGASIVWGYNTADGNS